MNTQEKLEVYFGLLKKWQEKINLVSSSTLENAWVRHFEDSLQINNLIKGNAPKILFDLGSGAGFPGLVLAISNPNLDVHLVESDQKKCSFMKSVSRETGVKVDVHCERIEKFNPDIVPDIISARALASLISLFDYCEKWISANDNLVLIFPKGTNAQEEIDELSKKWTFNLQKFPSKTDQNATILCFKGAKRLD